jgi:oligosaccharide repeat unit polymerase
MSTAAQPIPAFRPASLPMPTGAFEVLSYLGAVAIGTLCYLMGWLQPKGGVVVTTLLLASLIVLAYKRFDQGRHPCFLFLGMLMLFQGGRLLTYCLGSEPDPLRIRVQTYFPFDLSRDEAGIVLLCLALSAICIYAPCRWNHRRIAPPSGIKARQYLPYLYLLFFGSLPIQLFKNYSYYEFAQSHGGYSYFWVNHGEFAASVPLLVRLISLVTLPAFVGIFILETRKKYLYAATTCYFGSSLLLLLLGSRMATFGLILTLWYVSGIKSGKKSRFFAMIGLAFALILAGDIFQKLREDSDNLDTYAFDPLEFVTVQGNSLDVTEVAVKYRGLFVPYAGSYLWNELQNAFVPHDYQHYFRGRELSQDISVLLNPGAFSQGFGTAGSYLAEEYMVAGLAGVIAISLLIGIGLRALYRLSGSALSLFVVAMILPDVLGMPRGNLLDWLSVLFRTALSLVVLAIGFLLYRTVIWLKQAPGTGGILPAETGVA